jgi:hypothetical protein
MDALKNLRSAEGAENVARSTRELVDTLLAAPLGAARTALQTALNAPSAAVFKLLLSQFDTHMSDAPCAEQACRALNELVFQHSANQAAAGSQGAVAILVKCMQVHSMDIGVQECACRALSSLSFHEENVQRIESVGGVAAIAYAMRQHLDVVQVQKQGIRLVNNISYDNTRNQVSVGAAGGVFAILAAMRTHVHTELIQEYGCLALLNLSTEESNLIQMERSGALVAVKCAIERFPGYTCRRFNMCACRCVYVMISKIAAYRVHMELQPLDSSVLIVLSVYVCVCVCVCMCVLSNFECFDNIRNVSLQAYGEILIDSLDDSTPGTGCLKFQSVADCVCVCVCVCARVCAPVCACV